jgi:hypothetical protein
MTPKTDDFLQLRQDIARKNRLEAKLAELRQQRRIFDKKIFELRVDYRKEQEDVQKLEGRSLANYFYQVFGQMEAKLDRERREAYAAKVKLDAAQRELAELDEQISQVIAEQNALFGCEKAYADALERKRDALKASGTPAAAQILELEERISVLESRKLEIREAITAGNQAMAQAKGVLECLEKAEDWNTWDILGGGGIITHMAKHSHLDDAQDSVERLQVQLCRFKTELADVRIDADMKVTIDGFLQFADYFFDGLFADWAVGERITQSQNTVHRVKNQIREALNSLESMEKNTDRELTDLKARWEELLIRS